MSVIVPAIPNKNVVMQFYPLKTDEAVVEGAAVYLDANGDVNVCGADPATIGGFAMHGASAGANAVLEIDIYNGYQLVALAYPGSTFIIGTSGQLDDADVGVAYGIVADGTTGIWYLDLTETTNTRVRVESYDTTIYSEGLAEVSVLTANRQFAD